MKECKLCSDIKDLIYMENHEDGEFIFGYAIARKMSYKYFKDRSYSDIISCPKCGRILVKD